MTSLEQQTDKRFLIFESQRGPNSDIETQPLHSFKFNWFWSTRLVLIKEQHNVNFWDFTAFDLLMNEYRSIHFPKTSKNSYDIHVFPLDNEFGLIVEEDDYIWRINFVKFDWDTNEFQLNERIEKQCDYLRILVDKAERSKFVLECYHDNRINDYQICTLVKSKIEFGEIHQFNRLYDFYSNGKLILVCLGYQTKITVYDWSSKKEESFEIARSSLPKDVKMYGPCEWVNDRLYKATQLKNTEKYGLEWADLETKRWDLINFESDLGIKKLWLFNDNLILKTGQFGSRYLSKIKFSSIPMRRPNPLRQSAWIFVVKTMKKNGEKDPYAAAKESLPLNSDLRAHWFKDKEQPI